MRTFFVLLGLGGCFGGGPRLDPELFVLSPSGGTEVTDHAPISIEIEVYDVAADRIDLAVDGTTVSAGAFSVTPPPTGDPCAPCNFTIVWDALDAREGSHVVSVNAFTNGALKAVGTVALAFDDTPEILSIAPAQDEDLLGVGTYTVRVSAIERGEATMSLTIDGAEATTTTSSECRTATGCSLQYIWDTAAIPVGAHELRVTVTDKNGNVADQTRMVTIDDLVKVTSMELANTTDESGTLEIEVYVFDNVTNAFLGCAGRVAGLGDVDASGVRYAVDAQLVGANDGAGLRAEVLKAHAVRFEVWEDDDDPICPSPVSASGNDQVGVSPAKSLAQWKATPAITFGNVTELAIQIGRPLTR